MSYVIRYFRAGKEQGSTPWGGSLAMMQKIAADGLVRHGMDRVEIADESGAVLWRQVGNDVTENPVRDNFLQSTMRAIGGVARGAGLTTRAGPGA
jgi:hypothetical protein